jgi:hypothetical protein
MKEVQAARQIADFNGTFGYNPDRDVLFVQQLKALDLPIRTVAAILDITESICKHCYDAPNNCQCWNDE